MPNTIQKSWTIYYALNKVNNKAYVGKTSCSIADRWSRHKRESKTSGFHFHNAIKTYGEDAFEVRAIDTASTESRANEFEKFYIQLFDTYKRDRGYNLTMGGDGGELTEEIRKKISENHKKKGIKPSLEAARKGGAATRGTKKSPEACKKLSATLKAIGHRLPDWAAAIGRERGHETCRRTQTGVPRPREVGLKVSATKMAKISNEEIVRLYASGLSSLSIGKKLGRSSRAIRNRLHKLGVAVRSAGPYKKNQSNPSERAI